MRLHVSRRKAKSGKLSVFKGREARLNKAIFHILALKSPLTIYAIRREVTKRRLLHRKLYSVVNRRVRILQQLGYVEKVGTRKTLAGSTATLYQITPRAYLAILLNQINLENLVLEVDETAILELVAILSSAQDIY